YRVRGGAGDAAGGGSGDLLHGRGDRVVQRGPRDVRGGPAAGRGGELLAVGLGADRRDPRRSGAVHGERVARRRPDADGREGSLTRCRRTCWGEGAAPAGRKIREIIT